MLKYAIKSMWARKTTTILFIIALVVALTISMVAVNISSQVNEGFIRADSEYDIIIGPNGSDIQLVMSTLFFSDKPLGLIDYSYVNELKSRGDLQYVLPFALGDSYNGHNLVGSRSEFLRNKKIIEGSNFEKPFEAVVGYNVARRNNLKVGDIIITAHGVAEHHINSLACLFHDHDDDNLELHDDHPYKVVGILGKSNTAYDNAVFTDIESIWLSHGNEIGAEYEKKATAIVIRSGNQALAGRIMREFNENSQYQGVNPTSVMRRLTTNIDISKQVAFLLCGVILILAFIIIWIMTVLMLNSIKGEVKTLRFIGLDNSLIGKFILYQNIILAIVGAMVSIIASRGVLYIANMLSSIMGIVIDPGKFYIYELAIMVVVIALCLAPIIAFLRNMFKESLSNETL